MGPWRRWRSRLSAWPRRASARTARRAPSASSRPPPSTTQAAARSPTASSRTPPCTSRTRTTTRRTRRRSATRSARESRRASSRAPRRSRSLLSKVRRRRAHAAIVKETLAEAGPKLFKLTVPCDPECGVASDGRVVSLEDAKKLFVLPPARAARHRRELDRRSHQAARHQGEGRPGARAELRRAAHAVVRTRTTSAARPRRPEANRPRTSRSAPPSSSRCLGLTAVSGGILIWSGIDTINNPGADAVRQRLRRARARRARSTRHGRRAQTRTNVLIGVTSGLGLAHVRERFPHAVVAPQAGSGRLRRRIIPTSRPWLHRARSGVFERTRLSAQCAKLRNR